MNVMEVVYRRGDGMIVRSLAFYSYRSGPIGEWMLGDTPLRDAEGELIYQGPRLSDEQFAMLAHPISTKVD